MSQPVNTNPFVIAGKTLAALILLVVVGFILLSVFRFFEPLIYLALGIAGILLATQAIDWALHTLFPVKNQQPLIEDCGYNDVRIYQHGINDLSEPTDRPAKRGKRLATRFNHR